MAIAILTWLVAIPLLGAMTGLRSMTPIALICLFAYDGRLDVDGTWAAWTGSHVWEIVFGVLAVGELIGDKLPFIPDRISPFPLAVRIAFGGLVGAIAATSVRRSVVEGVLLASFSACLWTFLGYYVRRLLVEMRDMPPFAVALAEDALAIGLSIWAIAIVAG